MKIYKKIILTSIIFLMTIVSANASQNRQDFAERRGPAYSNMIIKIKCPANEGPYAEVTRGNFSTSSSIVGSSYFMDINSNPGYFIIAASYSLSDGTSYVPSTMGYTNGYTSYEYTTACQGW